MTVRRHATNIEVIAINDLLRQHIEIISPAEGEKPAVVRYKEDHFNDAKIAAIASQNNDPPLPEKSVAGLRLKLFGQLVSPTPAFEYPDSLQTDLGAIRMDIESVEKRVILAQNDAITAKKEARLVTEALNKVVAMLATNKVIDCGALLIRATDGSIPGVARAPHNGG